MLRQPVVVVLGHVDSGKTSLLDRIRGTIVQAREAGGITQHIGASFFPLDTIKQVCGRLFERFGAEVKIPGLLVIDTPGHEVFANLRARGGSAADIAILVVDANKGFEAQTYESIEILKSRKVPFLVALNKIDMIRGWKDNKTNLITESLKKQDKSVIEELDNKIYNVVGALSRLGFESEAFYRITNFKKQVAIIPVSAKTGEGIAELLAMLIGLTQQYLQKRLEISDFTKGIVLEVKEEEGLGTTANIILLDGKLKQGDRIMLAKRDGIIITRVKALLLPKPLDEMRDPRDKFRNVQEVSAAIGVKIVSPDMEGVLAGTPIYSIKSEEEIPKLKDMLESEIKSILIDTDSIGVIVKCDTLGSLEAIIDMLKRSNIPIRKADIGLVTKRDVIEANAVKEKDRYYGVILAFNVKVLPDAEEEANIRGVKIFRENIIYNLIREYNEWVEEEKRREEQYIFSTMTFPCKFQIMKGFVFRKSKPAVFGVEILEGRLRQKSQIMNEEGKDIGVIHQIQDRGESIEEAKKGMQVAVSMQEPTIGRQIDEGDMLYAYPKSEHAYLLLTKLKDRLSDEEFKLLEEIIEKRRKVEALYAYDISY
ncbi:MAG: translation initiation factor IF-2 [Candidatus Nitrosothermus koennekii]|nr:MAG: translation initiation factor IF-2 [Candidatus Nitrosothermus koennekii]